MDNGNENFFRDSANQLIHTLLYMDAIPESVRGTIPISYQQVPDYCKIFNEEELEQQATERDLKEVMKEQSINSFKDFSNFSETEKKLAEIWRDVLLLSKEEYEALDKESDFFDLTPSWCVTFEINSLLREISRVFGISTDSLPVDDYSTLSEQAALINNAIKPVC